MRLLGISYCRRLVNHLCRLQSRAWIINKFTLKVATKQPSLRLTCLRGSCNADAAWEGVIVHKLDDLKKSSDAIEGITKTKIILASFWPFACLYYILLIYRIFLTVATENHTVQVVTSNTFYTVYRLQYTDVSVVGISKTPRLKCRLISKHCKRESRRSRLESSP